MGCSTLQMELTGAICNEYLLKLTRTVQFKDRTVNSIRLIKRTPFNRERTELDATINAWIHEIEK